MSGCQNYFEDYELKLGSILNEMTFLEGNGWEALMIFKISNSFPISQFSAYFS